MQARRGSGGKTLHGRANAPAHDDLDVLGENVGIGGHIRGEPVQQVPENRQGEVVDDEGTVLGKDLKISFELVDDRCHHGAQGCVEETLRIAQAERGKNGVGLFPVLGHVYEHLAQAVRPLVVGGVRRDVVRDFFFEHPDDQVVNVRKW